MSRREWGKSQQNGKRMRIGREEGQAMAGVVLLGAMSALSWDINEHNEED